jgi:hypothetical protein
MKTVYLVLVGSQLYGLANEQSDEDYKGVFAPDKKHLIQTYEQMLGLEKFVPHKKEKFNYRNDGGPDEDILFSIQYFMELYYKGNPTLTEIPFADEQFVIEKTEIGERLMQFVKENLITRHLFGGYMGYFNDQVKAFLKGKGRNREKRLQKGGVLPSGYDIDPTFRSIFENPNDHSEKVYSNAVQYIRQELISQGWYDGKAMSHAYRIGVQGLDLFRDGVINPTLEGEQLDIARRMKFLSDDRYNSDRISRQDAIDMVTHVGSSLEEAKNNSSLAYGPDFDKTNRFLVDLQKEYYGI